MEIFQFFRFLIFELLLFDIAISNKGLIGSPQQTELISTDSTEITALGRVAQLGELYDARKDSFLNIYLHRSKIGDDAVTTADISYSNIDYVFTETLSDKMQKLGVQAELSVSVLAGLFTFSGSGSYLKDDKKSAKSVKTSLISKIRTVKEELNIFSNVSVASMNSVLLKNIEATHVVVAIERGGDVVLSLEDTNVQSSHFQDIQGQFKAELQKIAFSISGSAGVDFKNSEIRKSKTFSFHLHGDVIPDTVPSTLEEAVNFIKIIPNLIKKERDRQGKPMKYTLIPISMVRKVLQTGNYCNKIVRPLDQDLIDQSLRVFQEFKDSELEINDMYSEIRTWRHFLPENQLTEILKLKTGFDSFVNRFRVNFKDLVLQFRNGDVDSEALAALITSYEKGNLTYPAVMKSLEAFNSATNRILLLTLLRSSGASLIDRRTQKTKILAQHYKEDVRIISIDVGENSISSSDTHETVELLEKSPKNIKYFLEDVVINAPKVTIYIRGKETRSFPVNKKEYLFVKDRYGWSLKLFEKATTHSKVEQHLKDPPLPPPPEKFMIKIFLEKLVLISNFFFGIFFLIIGLFLKKDHE